MIVLILFHTFVHTPIGMVLAEQYLANAPGVGLALWTVADEANQVGRGGSQPQPRRSGDLLLLKILYPGSLPAWCPRGGEWQPPLRPGHHEIIGN